jgi:sugar phosphate permease
MQSAISLAAGRSGDGHLVSRRGAWFVFAMTFLLMAFEFVDRQIAVSMFPFMKAERGVSDTQLGVLVSVVSITVALGTFPVAVLVDRWSRVKSIALPRNKLRVPAACAIGTCGLLVTAFALLPPGPSRFLLSTSSTRASPATWWSRAMR